MSRHENSPAGWRWGLLASCPPRYPEQRSGGSCRSPSRPTAPCRKHTRAGAAIGVDLGVKALLTGADDRGTVIMIPGPKPLRTALRRLRRASRAHSRKQKGSANRRESAARLARIHARVTNIRADALHKATSMLATRYETIVCEDLNIAGMIRSRRLARAVSDQGFGTARRMLATRRCGTAGRLIVADRWHPSSKTCSGCGHVKAKLALSERTYRCVLRSGPGPRRKRRPEPARPRRQWGGEDKRLRRDDKTRLRRAVPGETGTRRPHGDKTGTATRQRAAVGSKLTTAY